MLIICDKKQRFEQISMSNISINIGEGLFEKNSVLNFRIELIVDEFVRIFFNDFNELKFQKILKVLIIDFDKYSDVNKFF